MRFASSQPSLVSGNRRSFLPGRGNPRRLKAAPNPAIPPEFSVSGVVEYYGYRYYHSNLGRWLSRDPIGENGGLNLYSLVRNNGINNIDLLGLNPTGKHEVVGTSDDLDQAFKAGIWDIKTKWPNPPLGDPTFMSVIHKLAEFKKAIDDIKSCKCTIYLVCRPLSAKPVPGYWLYTTMSAQGGVANLTPQINASHCFILSANRCDQPSAPAKISVSTLGALPADDFRTALTAQATFYHLGSGDCAKCESIKGLVAADVAPPYNKLGPNSNSFAHRVANELGFPDPFNSNPDVPPIGWGNQKR